MARPRDRISQLLARDERRQFACAALVDRADGSRHPARVSNLSYAGCQLESEVPMAVGEAVRLVLPSLGVIRAQVRWVAGDKAGALFDE
jgi:hypothetical protein